MRVIVIRGNDDIGKTRTIRHIFATLIENGAKVVEHKTIGHLYEDFQAVVEFRNKVIVVNSLADDGYFDAIQEGRTLAIKNSAYAFVTAWNCKLDIQFDYDKEFPKERFETTMIEICKYIPIHTELKKQTKTFCDNILESYLN